MVEIASKIVLCLSIAAVIGFLIGFILGRATRRENSTAYNINPVFTKQGNIYNKPFILGHPRPCGKDDLKGIEGIDDAIETALNDMGIFHYDQIAKWTVNNCDWIEEHLALPGQITENNWIEQAKKLSFKI